MDKKKAEEKRHLFAVIHCGSNEIGKIAEGESDDLVVITDAKLVWVNGAPKLVATYGPAPTDHESRDDPASWFAFPKTFAGIAVEYKPLGGS